MTLAPSRLRRRKLLIILSRDGTDAQVKAICCVQYIYDHSNLSELTVAERAVVDEGNALYLIADPEDDPTQFDACAFKGTIDTSDFETAIDGL